MCWKRTAASREKDLDTERIVVLPPGHLRARRSHRVRSVTDTTEAPVVGMVGAGQLARMTAQAAIGLGVGFRVLAGSAADSAAQVCANVQVGDYTSRDDLLAFAGGCDVVTFDHEHVPGPHLAALEKVVAVRPGADALRYTQDKLAMRERLAGLGVPCPRYAPVSSLAEVTAFAAESGWPVVLKAISGGYDGRGVWICPSAGAAAEVIAHPVA